MGAAGTKSESRPDKTALIGGVCRHCEVVLKSVLELLAGASGRLRLTSKSSSLQFHGVKNYEVHTLNDHRST
jgi:hypothetical protein